MILLAIAIGTILRLESYNFKKLLPKVVIMAVLVNFSLVITGLIIDFSQVILFTFATAFAETGGKGAAQLASLLQVDKMVNSVSNAINASGDTSTLVTIFAVTSSAILAVILVLVSIVVVLAMI
ncbi:hypothetical protein IIB79_12740, partial [candidate division KSB1 bacterium]|nr:hypothetical protein [candidate division KSB1 bacterium]